MDFPREFESAVKVLFDFVFEHLQTDQKYWQLACHQEPGNDLHASILRADKEYRDEEVSKSLREKQDAVIRSAKLLALRIRDCPDLFDPQRFGLRDLQGALRLWDCPPSIESGHRKIAEGKPPKEQESYLATLALCVGGVKKIEAAHQWARDHSLSVPPKPVFYRREGMAGAEAEAIFVQGQVFDASKMFADIIAKAKGSIVIIDGYINEKVLDMLTAKGKTVSVKMLTEEKSISPAFKTLAADFNKQYGGLEIRTSGVFHDRFVIVDDSHFYHCGASIKDAGKKCFRLSRMQEAQAIGDLRANWIKEWNAARIEVG